ncbi:MAG TPA: redoxin domain-containing protein [Thermoanaerobaculia bacterium]|nr:redoxin domain-containing protein [Thermoanaerobaculia bacterium]
MRRDGRLAGVASALFVITLASRASALDIGAVAPDFHIRTLDGQEVWLAEAEKSHRAIVVLFLSTICPYSNYYNDLIRDMAVEFDKKGVLFIGINSGRIETAEEARTHALEHGHTFPIAKDPQNLVAERLGARRTPEVFVLDASGRLVYHGRVASKISSPDLKNALDALLAGRPVKPAETKAFGCAIPRG